MKALGADHCNRIEDDDGLMGIGIAPAFAIDQRALILPTAHLRILWETVSLVTPEAVKRATAEGPIDLIAISHPHFYSSMAEWSEALGGAPIYIHEADREWLMRSSSNIMYWSGDVCALAEGVRLIRAGGHFPGSAVLHWMDDSRPKGALFTGDALQVTPGGNGVSFMYSYPNLIPMRAKDVEDMRGKLGGCAFEDAYGYTWRRNIIGGARKAVERSFVRYLDAVRPAHLAPAAY